MLTVLREILSGMVALIPFLLSPPQNNNLILLVRWFRTPGNPSSCYISKAWVNLPASVLKCLPTIQMFLGQEYPSSKHHLSLSELKPNLLHPLPASSLEHNIFKIFQCLPNWLRRSKTLLQTIHSAFSSAMLTLSPLPFPPFLSR